MIEGNGRLPVGGGVGVGNGRFKCGHIQRIGRVGTPLHRLAVALQEQIRVGQLFAQAGVNGTQVGEGLLLAGVGPEEEGNVAARLWGAAVQQQVDEECLQPV